MCFPLSLEWTPVSKYQTVPKFLKNFKKAGCHFLSSGCWFLMPWMSMAKEHFPLSCAWAGSCGTSDQHLWALSHTRWALLVVWGLHQLSSLLPQPCRASSVSGTHMYTRPPSPAHWPCRWVFVLGDYCADNTLTRLHRDTAYAPRDVLIREIVWRRA